MVFVYASPVPGSSIELPKGHNTERTPNDWCYRDTQATETELAVVLLAGILFTVGH